MKTTSHQKKSLLPLLWVMLFDHMSLTMTFPILTLLFFDAETHLFTPDTSHAVRSLWYGLCVAVPNIVNILMTPLLSAMSDEFGRKKILFIGTIGAFLFAITAGLGIFWGSLSLLFLGRVIQGAFSRTNPIAQAIVGDISPREKKVRHMGYLQLSISLGAFIGPVIGGYFANQFFFQKLNFSLPYFIAAFMAAISCLLTLYFFKETLVKPNDHQKKKLLDLPALKKVFANRQVLFISTILLLSQISWSLYYQFIPPVLKTTLDFSADSLGLFVGLIAFWLALASGFGIKILEYFFSARQILILSLYLVFFGLLLCAACLLSDLTGSGLLLFWLGAIPIAMGDVIAFSCLTTLYSDVVQKDEQGKVMGICFIVIGVIWSLTAMVGGMMMGYAERLPLLIAPVGVLFAIILMHYKAGESSPNGATDPTILNAIAE